MAISLNLCQKLNKLKADICIKFRSILFYIKAKVARYYSVRMIHRATAIVWLQCNFIDEIVLKSGIVLQNIPRDFK